MLMRIHTYKYALNYYCFLDVYIYISIVLSAIGCDRFEGSDSTYYYFVFSPRLGAFPLPRIYIQERNYHRANNDPLDRCLHA